MFFRTTLVPAILKRRYKRFLAEVTLEDGREITVYCPNTGSMRTCSTPGSRVYLSHSDKKGRKYPFTLEMVREQSSWVGVNTSLTNDIVAEAIVEGRIAELSSVDEIKREVKVSDGTRLDLLLKAGNVKTYVEVKNCSMAEGEVTMFPDAVTARGIKHLHELAALVKGGDSGIIFFLVQRMDAKIFRPAAHIDPLYAEMLARVHRQGVQILVYQAEVTPRSIEVTGSLPFAMAE